MSVRSAITRFLDDLRGTLETNVEAARRRLRQGLDRIILRLDADGHLWAEMRGNPPGNLKLDDGGFLALVPGAHPGSR